MMNEFPGRQTETFGENLLNKPKNEFLSLVLDYIFKMFVLPLFILLGVIVCLMLIGALAVITSPPVLYLASWK